jgi:5'-nucleotidase
MSQKYSELQKVFFVFLSLFLISCSHPQKTGLLHEVTIIGTADLQGLLEPTELKLDFDGDGKKEERSVGGISRIATLIKNIKSEKQEKVMVVSTGDDLMNRYFHTFKGKAIFRLLSEAGYEIYAFGNHEFDKGPEVLAGALEEAVFQSICTDLEVINTPLDGLCNKLVIRDFQGLKAGFFSLMTEDFPLVTSGRDVTLTRNNLETARWAVKELRKQGAEIVVALTHIGFSRDQEIAKAVPGIDVIFGAHSHDYLPELVKVGGTAIVNGGEKGSFLVRLDLLVGSDGSIDHNKTRYQLIPVTDEVVSEAKIERLLADYKKSFPEAIILARTEVAWNMTKEALRKGESVVANLVNDLLREKFHVEVVLNNAGAFRGKKIYQPGPVTDAMLKEIDEFSNYAYTLKIKGKYIKKILERSAARFGKGGFLHPSGLRYTIDLSQTAQKISMDGSGELDVEIPGSLVKEIQVFDKTGKWEDLNPDKSYYVLSNSFLVNQQGDGFFWFKRFGKDLKNTYSTFYSILAELAENKGILNPGSPDKRVIVY